jgi:hypothetical protein
VRKTRNHTLGSALQALYGFMARSEARARAFMALLLSVALTAAVDTDTRDGVISSLRQALREARASMRTSSAATARGRQLNPAASAQAATPEELCSSGDCLIELTTGIAGWTGAGATVPDPHWAPVYWGKWIGDGNPETAQGLLIASVSFRISEPACASFNLALAADGKVQSAQLNGRPLAVPSHTHRTTTSLAGTAGLVAARGIGNFVSGINTLVLTVVNDAGALGLYVQGSVQLLCPMDEATVSMKPAHGPTAGHTTVVLTSNVQVRACGWQHVRMGERKTTVPLDSPYSARVFLGTARVFLYGSSPSRARISAIRARRPTILFAARATGSLSRFTSTIRIPSRMPFRLGRSNNFSPECFVPFALFCHRVFYHRSCT